MKTDIRHTYASLYEAHIQRVRTYLADNYGATVELQKRLARVGNPVARSSFTRWFHADPRKRQQPALGTFLLIERLVADMRLDWGKK